MAGKFKQRDVAIAIGTLVLLFVVLLLPMLNNARTKAKRIRCVSHLKQIGLSYGIWANGSSNDYPMYRSEEFGGTRESALTGNVVPTYLAMSNELSVPRILTCLEDTRKTVEKWTELAEQNVSYFIGLDAEDIKPDMLLSGDRNLAIDGELLSGLVELGTNSPVSYTDSIHVQVGNIGLADGSVQQVTTELLRKQMIESGDETNRLVFPQ